LAILSANPQPNHFSRIFLSSQFFAELAPQREEDWIKISSLICAKLARKLLGRDNLVIVSQELDIGQSLFNFIRNFV